MGILTFIATKVIPVARLAIKHGPKIFRVIKDAVKDIRELRNSSNPFNEWSAEMAVRARHAAAKVADAAMITGTNVTIRIPSSNTSSALQNMINDAITAAGTMTIAAEAQMEIMHKIMLMTNLAPGYSPAARQDRFDFDYRIVSAVNEDVLSDVADQLVELWTRAAETRLDTAGSPVLDALAEDKTFFPIQDRAVRKAFHKLIADAKRAEQVFNIFNSPIAPGGRAVVTTRKRWLLRHSNNATVSKETFCFGYSSAYTLSSVTDGVTIANVDAVDLLWPGPDSLGRLFIRYGLHDEGTMHFPNRAPFTDHVALDFDGNPMPDSATGGWTQNANEGSMLCLFVNSYREDAGEIRETPPKSDIYAWNRKARFIVAPNAGDNNWTFSDQKFLFKALIFPNLDDAQEMRDDQLVVVEREVTLTCGNSILIPGSGLVQTATIETSVPSRCWTLQPGQVSQTSAESDYASLSILVGLWPVDGTQTAKASDRVTIGFQMEDPYGDLKTLMVSEDRISYPPANTLTFEKAPERSLVVDFMGKLRQEGALVDPNLGLENLVRQYVGSGRTQAWFETISAIDRLINNYSDADPAKGAILNRIQAELNGHDLIEFAALDEFYYANTAWGDIVPDRALALLRDLIVTFSVFVHSTSGRILARQLANTGQYIP